MTHQQHLKQQFFDRWAPSYDWLFPSVFYQAVHQRLLEFVTLPNSAQVLDLGCGTGRLLNRLAAQFPTLQGIGLDLSSQMLAQARRGNRHRPRLIFAQGRADAIPFAEDQFDAIFNTISFLHYPQPETVLSEVNRVLRPSGRFYLVDSTFLRCRSELTYSNPIAGTIRLYNPEMRETLGTKAGFSCLGHYYLLGTILLTVFAK